MGTEQKFSTDQLRTIALELHKLQKKAQQALQGKTFFEKATGKKWQIVTARGTFNVMTEQSASSNGIKMLVDVLPEKSTGEVFIRIDTAGYCINYNDWKSFLKLLTEVDAYIDDLNKENLKEIL